jgi:hypothetical protein
VQSIADGVCPSPSRSDNLPRPWLRALSSGLP